MGRKWLIVTGSKRGEFHFIDVTDKPAELVLEAFRKKQQQLGRHRETVEAIGELK